MQSFFGTTNGMSPVSQDFIWVGEYSDGTHLSEFDFVTKHENSFYSIERDRLIRFGLVGHGLRLFFESDGLFNLNGKGYEIAYRVGDKVYSLTGHYGKFRDIITYKDAEATVNLAGRGGMRTQITQFNFGYKTELDLDGVKCNFKAIVKIPFGQPMHLNIRLVADDDFSGALIIKRVNDQKVWEIDAPLQKGSGGEINFTFS